jgi:hypothetical protein
LPGKRGPTELIVRVGAALAAGRGIRAVARVFAVDPKTGLAWVIAVADPLDAFARLAGLAHQHGVQRADQPHDPPACGRRRVACDHAVHRRGRRMPATHP